MCKNKIELNTLDLRDEKVGEKTFYIDNWFWSYYLLVNDGEPY